MGADLVCCCIAFVLAMLWFVLEEKKRTQKTEAEIRKTRACAILII